MLKDTVVGPLLSFACHFVVPGHSWSIVLATERVVIGQGQILYAVRTRRDIPFGIVVVRCRRGGVLRRLGCRCRCLSRRGRGRSGGRGWGMGNSRSLTSHMLNAGGGGTGVGGVGVGVGAESTGGDRFRGRRNGRPISRRRSSGLRKRPNRLRGWLITRRFITRGTSIHPCPSVDNDTIYLTGIPHAPARTSDMLSSEGAMTGPQGSLPMIFPGHPHPERHSPRQFVSLRLRFAHAGPANPPGIKERRAKRAKKSECMVQ
jgi:hypothetical protein